MSGDGKTTTAVRLALAFANSGQKVLLTDLDHRRPSIHEVFQAAKQPGLTDIVNGRATISEGTATIPSVHPNLVAIPAGTPVQNPTNFVASPAFDDYLARLSEAADLVILDSSPILQVADALTAAGRCDGVVLVVRARHTTKQELARTVDEIERSGGRLIGVILSQSRVSKKKKNPYTSVKQGAVPMFDRRATSGGNFLMEIADSVEGSSPRSLQAQGVTGKPAGGTDIWSAEEVEPASTKPSPVGADFFLLDARSYPDVTRPIPFVFPDDHPFLASARETRELGAGSIPPLPAQDESTGSEHAALDDASANHSSDIDDDTDTSSTGGPSTNDDALAELGIFVTDRTNDDSDHDTDDDTDTSSTNGTSANDDADPETDPTNDDTDEDSDHDTGDNTDDDTDDDTDEDSDTSSTNGTSTNDDALAEVGVFATDRANTTDDS